MKPRIPGSTSFQNLFPSPCDSSEHRSSLDAIRLIHFTTVRSVTEKIRIVYQHSQCLFVNMSFNLSFPNLNIPSHQNARNTELATRSCEFRPQDACGLAIVVPQKRNLLPVFSRPDTAIRSRCDTKARQQKETAGSCSLRKIGNPASILQRSLFSPNADKGYAELSELCQKRLATTIVLILGLTSHGLFQCQIDYAMPSAAYKSNDSHTACRVSPTSFPKSST